MPKDIVINMGGPFTLTELIDKLKELGLPDLFSERGAPLTSTCCVGATGVHIEGVDEHVDVISFREYDWPENPTNVEYSIFDYYDNLYMPRYPHYVCVVADTIKTEFGQDRDVYEPATKLVICDDGSHRYAYVA